MCLRLDMRRALDQLNSLERRAVVLISLADLTVREAAEELSIPRNSCHRLHRAGVTKLERHLSVYRSP